MQHSLIRYTKYESWETIILKMKYDYKSKKFMKFYIQVGDTERSQYGILSEYL